jgi:hypothetical protein
VRQPSQSQSPNHNILKKSDFGLAQAHSSITAATGTSMVDWINDFWYWDCIENQWHPAPVPTADSGHWPPHARLLVANYDPGEATSWFIGSFNGIFEMWGWNREIWAKAEPEDNAGDGNPPAHSYGAMAYDSTSQQTLMFSGWKYDPEPSGLWSWAANDWTLLSEADPANLQAPQDRVFAAMAYDELRQKLVLFGGKIDDDAERGDTWEWDGLNWELVLDEDPGNPDRPSPRVMARMIYDRHRKVVFMMDGVHVDNELVTDGRFWEWDGTAWTRVESENDLAPPYVNSGPYYAYQYLRLIYDDQRRKALAFISTWAQQKMELVWEWDGTNWLERQVADPSSDGFPASASGRYATYDTDAGVALLYGGESNTYIQTNQFWQWHSGFDRHPGHVMRTPLDLAGIDPDGIQSVSVTWFAGADSQVQDTGLPLAGAELLTWKKGTWSTVDTNQAPGDVPDKLEYTAMEPEHLREMMVGTHPYLGFAVVPRGVSGTGLAEISSQYTELKVNYFIPDAPATLSCSSPEQFNNTTFGSSAVDSYDDVNGNYEANEVVFPFQADCDGDVTLVLTKKPNVAGFLDLFLMDGNAGCPGSNLITYAWMIGGIANLTAEVAAGSPYCIIVDGYSGATGAFLLNVECSCGE